MRLVPTHDAQQPLLLRVKGLTPRNIALDVMHTVDLGLVQHIIGNILFEICYDTFDDAQTGLSIVWQRIRDIYIQLGITNKISFQCS